MFQQHIVFLILTLLSHIAASIFFAKPRFNLLFTSLIWIAYGVYCFCLLVDTPTLNFFISFVLHFILFIISTKGRMQEKVFLFLSYACINTCFSMLYNIIVFFVKNTLLNILIAFLTVVLMQVALYIVMLPSFKKVTPYIKSGWWSFYAIVIAFLVLFITMTIFQIETPFTNKETVVYLLTAVIFCVTYIAVFNSMKNIVELSKEKQKQIQNELLQAQVDAQAKETETVKQNRHDMRHHYQMLLSLAKDGKLDDIKDYLIRQNESIETMTTGRFCENETVNNILKVYRKKAKEKDIKTQIVAAVKPQLTIPAPELVQIVANVLENALHGATQSKKANAFINVSIKHKSQHLVLTCENSCVEELNFTEMPEDLYGIGIHSIISTAGKFGGTYSFSANRGVFTAKIVMDE
jgi:hypothetical protein